jgi:quercetin dioxygenase-like cupin family protein
MKSALLCLVLLTAQATTPEVEITAEPHHHLTFENKSVRVFNVEVPPHSDTLMHWHRHDYIYVTLGDTELINAVKDKPPVTVKLQDGETRFSPATFAHIARNVTDRPFRNVTIEIIEDEALRNSAAHGDVKWDEDRGLETFAAGTKQILFVKDGIRATEFELQPNGVVPLHHHNGPHLLVAVTDLEIRSDVEGQGPNAGPMPGHFKAGDAKWLPGNYSHTITNIGPKPAKFVTLEIPVRVGGRTRRFMCGTAAPGCPSTSARIFSTALSRTQLGKRSRFRNSLLHSRPSICYKQSTESSSVASRSYCLQLSGWSGI